MTFPADSKLVTTVIPGYPGHIGGPNGKVTRWVCHATVSATNSHGAEDTGHYFERASSGGLAHYTVDTDSIVQSCPESSWCWHAPPNPGSIGMEMTDPATYENQERWHDKDHQAMLHLAAQLVADGCKRHDLPVRRLTSAMLKADPNGRGITDHNAVSLAFGQSDHSDPRWTDATWDEFIKMVKTYYDGIEEELTVAQVDEIKKAIKTDGDTTRKLVLNQPNKDGSDPDGGHYGLGDVERDLKAVGAHLGQIEQRLAALERK